MQIYWKYLFGLMVLLTGVVWLTVFSLPDNKLHLITCDVGQGDSILAVYKNVQVLVDGGPDKSVLDCLSRHVPFWDREIEVVVLTHPQLDHFGGLISVFKDYKVDYFLANPVENSTLTYSVLKKEVGGSTTHIVNPNTGMVIRLGLLYLDILWPARNFIEKEASLNGVLELKRNVLGAFIPKRDLNDFSVNLIVSYGSFDALLTGDIGPATIPDLIKEGGVREVEYLKVPHHGSKNGLTKELLELVNPKLAVISVGKNNRYGHPNKEILDLLKEEGIKTLRTDEKGDIEVMTDGIRVWEKN